MTQLRHLARCPEQAFGSTISFQMPVTRPRSSSTPRHAEPPLSAHRLRSGLAPLRVAYARARSRPGRGLLVALGVAVAAGLLAVVVGGSVVTGEQTLRRALGALP